MYVSDGYTRLYALLSMTDPLPQKPSTASIPANETERLAALHRYKILDTPPEAAFDRITRLAAQIFNMPTALVSLVDESRAWFKSCVGFGASEVPRDATLCSFVVLTDEPLIVPDAQQDARFACKPLVQNEPGVRFYAGAPLLSHDGFNMGTLCLLDSQPRDPFTPEQQATLVDLAAIVVDELELRLAAHKTAQVDAALLELTQGVATATGEAFFEALVQHFANVLDVDYVYIGVVEGDAPKMLRMIATCAEGQIVDNLEYSLQETPCWEVIEQRKICCYPHNVQALFPDAPLLKPLSVESYVAAPLFDSNGTPLGLLGVMDGKPLEHVDLAESLLTIFANRIATELERQQTEVTLRESEEKYRSLFELIDEGFCVCEMLFDENGEAYDYRFLEVNSVFERLTGLEQATGKTARELVPNLEAFWIEMYGKVAQTGESVRFEQQSITMKRWFDVNAFRIGAAQSHQFAILFTNISDRKTFEQERERFFAVSSDLQVITRIDGYFQWVSPTFERLLGWTVEEMTSRPWADFVHPDVINSSISETDSLFSGNETLAFENRYRHKDGSYRWLLWRAQPQPDEQVIYGAAVDITARQLAEAALQASEEQIRNILASIQDGFFALDQDWRFTYMNQAAETLTSRTASELIGKNLWEEFSGVNGSEFEQMHRRVMRDRVAASHTAFYPDHNRWYEVNSYPAANGITVYFRNVTDQIQAEAALRQSEERYRTLFESIDEGFCVLEVLFDENDVAIDYRYLEANPAFEQQTGFEQAIGKTVRQLVPNLEAYWFEIYGNVALTGEPARFQNWAEGMNRWFDVYAFRIEQPEQRKVAVLFKDITERQRTEAELRTQRQLLETVVNYLPSSVAIVRGRDLTFQFVNPMYQAALSKDMLGRTIQEVWSEQPLLADRCRRVLETGEPDRALDEAFAATRPGTDLSEVRYFSWSMHRITLPSEDGQGILMTIWETTERKQAEVERERLLQQAQAAREEAERANRIKDEFLAVLSHELRSPLNPILGWTRLMQNGKLDAARQAEALRTIERNAKLQTQLIEDLLDISRIMQGKLSLTAAPVSLTFVITAAIETVRLAAEVKNIQIKLDLASTIAPILGDTARLQQVFWNLLTNAVKFTPTGGQVTVELRQFNQLAQIRVIDTGRGINPQFLPYVFEYFRQEDGSTTRKFGGLGLGLA